MSLDMTSFEAALKEHYTNDAVENMVYADNPFLAMVPKYENFGGKTAPVPLIYANPQGRSATFTNAQARSTLSSTKLEDFVLKRVQDYSIATIDNETLEASKGDANAFMEAATTEIDGAIQSLTRSLAIALYKDGFGSIGQINATVTGTVLTLVNANDITNFEVGHVLVFSATSGASVLRANSLVVIGIDRSAGTMTVSANLNTITGITANDFIFIQGDRQNVASPVALKVSGLDAWIPSVAPTSTLFFNVDRTQDVTRLAGLRHDGTSQPIEEALIDLASKIAREGGKPTHCFVNYSKYAALEKSLGPKVQYLELDMDNFVGFRGILINGPRGVIKVIPDQNCPSNRAYMVQMDTWKLMSLGKAIRVSNTDGLPMLRQATADGVEVRYSFYGNLACKAPGYNGVALLPV